MFGFNFAPRGWAFCDGQILPINQNQSLYSLLGTTYGGDGRTNFALPDLRGRVPIHEGNSQTPGSVQHNLGSRAGAESHTLGAAETPAHSHRVAATSASGDSPVPVDNYLAAFNNGYADAAIDPSTLVAMRSDTVGNAGGGQPHPNTQPSLAIGFAIALQGLFPSRN
jgi:microcystin-dependent protein